VEFKYENEYEYFISVFCVCGFEDEEVEGFETAERVE
jgi:hypothetical protein